jgi:hypothetical protein
MTPLAPAAPIQTARMRTGCVLLLMPKCTTSMASAWPCRQGARAMAGIVRGQNAREDRGEQRHAVLANDSSLARRQCDDGCGDVRRPLRIADRFADNIGAGVELRYGWITGLCHVLRGGEAGRRARGEHGERHDEISVEHRACPLQPALAEMLAPEFHLPGLRTLELPAWRAGDNSLFCFPGRPRFWERPGCRRRRSGSIAHAGRTLFRSALSRGGRGDEKEASEDGGRPREPCKKHPGSR